MFLSWPEEDQDKALAWIADQAERCPGCGHRLSECTDKANATAYEADPIKCHVCYTRQMEALVWRDEPEERKAGLLIPVVRKS